MRFGESLVPVTALLLLSLTAGCDSGADVGRTFPVRGKVTLDGKPLTAASTVILFKPDATKGNTSPFEPAGTVDAEGNYTVSTKRRTGAPPGPYKVIVTAADLRAGEAKASPRHHPTPKSLLPAKYGVAATSPLAIEVVEVPAAEGYDLKLTSK
jgi:hypothetical protein